MMVESGRLPDKGTTRRIISDWFIKHRGKIMPHVLEVGSARPADAWWADLRSQLGGIERHEWTGVDMQRSECTDICVDLCARLFEGYTPLQSVIQLQTKHYGSCVCAETLEHVAYPEKFLKNVWILLRPGAWIVITTPFAFPIHGFPNDYWRFTPEGLKLLLKDAGFEECRAEGLAVRSEIFWDHEITPYNADDGGRRWDLPLWVGAIARKPE